MIGTKIPEVGLYIMIKKTNVITKKQFRSKNDFTLHAWKMFMIFLSWLIFFFQNQLFNTILSGKLSKHQTVLDPGQARRFVGPDLGPNGLQRLTADDTSRQRTNHALFGRFLQFCIFRLKWDWLLILLFIGHETGRPLRLPLLTLRLLITTKCRLL